MVTAGDECLSSLSQLLGKMILRGRIIQSEYSIIHMVELFHDILLQISGEV